MCPAAAASHFFILFFSLSFLQIPIRFGPPLLLLSIAPSDPSYPNNSRPATDDSVAAAKCFSHSPTTTIIKKKLLLEVVRATDRNPERNDDPAVKSRRV